MIFARALLFCFPLIRLLLIPNYCGVFATLVVLFRPRSHCCLVANSRSCWPDAGAYFPAYTESLCDHEDYIHTGRSGLLGLAITQRDGRTKTNSRKLTSTMARESSQPANHHKPLESLHVEIMLATKKPWQSWTIIKPAVIS